jgi:hypothetical protein
MHQGEHHDRQAREAYEPPTEPLIVGGEDLFGTHET